MKSLALLSFAGLLIALGAAVWFFLYSPSGLQQRSVFPAPATPNPAIAARVAEAEDVQIGEGIPAYFLPGKPGGPGLLYFHGNGVTIGEQIDIFETWRRAGYSVLAVEYRGYGGAPGLASEQTTYEDAHAAYRWLRQKLGAERPILVVGWSLGGTVAAEVADHEPVAGLVLLAAFSSMGDMARLRFPSLPFDRLLTYRLDTLDRVRRVRVPVLVVHGTEDHVVPFTMGRRLYEAATSPKRFLPLAGADHGEVFGAEVLRAMQRLLPFS